MTHPASVILTGAARYFPVPPPYFDAYRPRAQLRLAPSTNVSTGINLNPCGFAAGIVLVPSISRLSQTAYSKLFLTQMAMEASRSVLVLCISNVQPLMVVHNTALSAVFLSWGIDLLLVQAPLDRILLLVSHLRAWSRLIFLRLR